MIVAGSRSPPAAITSCGGHCDGAGNPQRLGPTGAGRVFQSVRSREYRRFRRVSADGARRASRTFGGQASRRARPRGAGSRAGQPGVRFRPTGGQMPNDITAPSDERRVAAWIGKALRIEGRIVSQEHLTIDGQVDGTIEVGDHSLVIGAGAQGKADLTAETITCSGEAP